MTVEVLILTTVFVGTALLVVAVYVYANRERLAESAASRARLEAARAAVANSGGDTSILRDERVSRLRFLERLLANRPVTALLQDEIGRAGSRMLVGELVLLAAVCAGVGAVIAQQYGGGLLVPVAALAFGAAPLLNLRRMQAARRAKFEAQLPDAIDMLVSAMRAGYSLQAGMNFVGQEMPAPLGPAFARFHDEHRLGVDVRTALLDLQDRVGTLDIKMFVTSVLIQRETGGNLGEVLTNIAGVMRDRVAFRGQVQALTAEPKLSARVLAAMPVVMFAVLSVISADYTRSLLTTDTGRLSLVYAAVSVAVGYAIMSKIADVEL